MMVRLDGLGASHRVGVACRRRLVVLSVATLLFVFLSHCAEHAHSFAFVPVVNTFAMPEKSGNKMESRFACQDSGGYMAGEPTTATHLSVIEAVRGAGAGVEWYAYLGASTDDSLANECPPPVTEHAVGSGLGQSFGCYWRWNQGRWTETDDNPELPLHIPKVGVTFYVGNYFRLPSSPSLTVYGVQGGFPSWFNATSSKQSELRPNSMFGQDLVAVGRGDTSSWSDNQASGGYSYAGFIFGSIYNTSIWDLKAQKSSQMFFWSVCQTQAPSALLFELEDTSSVVQNIWWVIFFAIIMVLCTIAFCVTVHCQEDESMDEPPEDAPEWAKEETNKTTRTKSFVSTRSFRPQPGDDNAGNYGHDMGNWVSQYKMNQGSMYDCNQGAGFQMPPNANSINPLYNGSRAPSNVWA
ncbi:hypothetical protein, unknown function [Leishmania tarentolae]|uniref:Uncharacterized protein n=1 Tax=Leishmania tarentolae TaxID=5689 RepID=A0A640KD66_LEITA|nr:hypothetical protein, unknown function [Leishmania tarentolae]